VKVIRQDPARLSSVLPKLKEPIRVIVLDQESLALLSALHETLKEWQPVPRILLQPLGSPQTSSEANAVLSMPWTRDRLIYCLRKTVN
jgi:hypothetical protein